MRRVLCVRDRDKQVESTLRKETGKLYHFFSFCYFNAANVRVEWLPNYF
jgi:hypothetical protein